MAHAIFVEGRPVKDFTIGPSNAPTKTDTSGDTISIKLIKYDDSSFTAVEVASVAGAAAGTAIVTDLDLSDNALVPGLYELEADPLLPNEATGFPFLVEIQPLRSV